MMVDELNIDQMDIVEAAEWLEKMEISFEGLESVDEMRLKIRQQISRDREQARPQSTKTVMDVGFFYILPIFLWHANGSISVRFEVCCTLT